MKRYNFCLAVLLLFTAVMFSGCNTAEEVPELALDRFDTEAEILLVEEAPEEELPQEPESVPVEEEDPYERVVVDGKIRSLYTGEWIPVEMAQERPLGMMLNNTKVALPMSGVNNASVIYECCVEGRITRWLGIFEDWKDLERIGSVRSCRQYYLHLAQEFDCIYAHFGQAIYALPELNSGEFDVLSGATAGIKKPATSMYDRISRPGKASEHTLYAFPSNIVKDIEKKGYRTELSEDYEGKFFFAPDGEVVTYDGYPEATLLQPGGTGGKNGFGGVKATFEYNPEDHLYYRSTYGSPHIDELTGEQLAVKNVIFQYCDGNVLDAKDYLSFATQTDLGKCIVFTEGKVIEGYWSNPGELGTPARYYEKDYTDLVINSGKTFICIIWNDFAEDVVYQ